MKVTLDGGLVLLRWRQRLAVGESNAGACFAEFGGASLEVGRDLSEVGVGGWVGKVGDYFFGHGGVGVMCIGDRTGVV